MTRSTLSLGENTRLIKADNLDDAYDKLEKMAKEETEP